MIHLAFMSLIYFLPTVIACHRGHNVGGIALLNFFIGWTGIGWLAMMLWAILSRPPYYRLPLPVYGPYTSWRRW